MTRALCAVVVGVALSAALLHGDDAAVVTAWTNGRWFNGTAFIRADVYSRGSRITLKRPRTVHRTVDLSGRYLVPAFGEAHNHNLPGPDVPGTIRRYLEQGIYYVMATLAALGGLVVWVARERLSHQPHKAASGG